MQCSSVILFDISMIADGKMMCTINPNISHHSSGYSSLRRNCSGKGPVTNPSKTNLLSKSINFKRIGVSTLFVPIYLKKRDCVSEKDFFITTTNDFANESHRLCCYDDIISKLVNVDYTTLKIYTSVFDTSMQNTQSSFVSGDAEV